MIKYIVLLIAVAVLAGCSAKGTLDMLPQAEFSRFEYHRGGSGAGAHIVAINSIKTPEGIMVEKVHIIADYPFVTFNILLEDYIRIYEE